MRLPATAIVAVGVLLGTTAGSAYGQGVEYVITPRIFAMAADGSGEAVLLGDTPMRTLEGRRALISLINREGTDGAKLVVVPTDLGGGRVGLRVEFELLRAGQSRTAKFDVLSGAQAQRATIVLRDAEGRFIPDASGRPLYATFDAVRNKK